LEQFCILARTQRSRACAALIQQVLSHRKIFTFGELLSMPSVQALKDEPEFCSAYQSLELFAYGTYMDYVSAPTGFYLELSTPQILKLKQLSLITLASAEKVIPYTSMLQAIAVESSRELEDMIIDVIYSGLLMGRLDHRNQLLRVQSVAARDVRPGQIAHLIETLNEWKKSFGQLNMAVKESSSYMRQQREMSLAESKAAQEVADVKQKQIKQIIDVGMDPLEELAELKSTSSHAFGNYRSSGMGMGAEEGMGMGMDYEDTSAAASTLRSSSSSNSSRPRPYPSGQRPSAGKHPRRQVSGTGGGAVGAGHRR